MVTGGLSAFARSMICTRPMPELEDLLLAALFAADESMETGKANKDLSEVGDNAHSPLGFGQVSKTCN
jgi:hypothetical protein